MERWTDYITEIFNDIREDIEINYNEEGPTILAPEVKDAIRHTHLSKASGPDNITKEEMDALGEFRIEVLTKLLNDIYNTGYIPKDLMKSVYIPLPKKPGTIECENHRTISLMSHVTKKILQIIMKRIKNKIR